MRPIILLLCVIALAGCQTDAKKQADAQKLQAAYLAGQQSTQPQFQQPSGVTILGEVRKRQILWRPELTLAEAIVEADFVGFVQPRSILLIRDGNRYEIDTPQLLSGESNPLIQPGDIINILR